MSGRMLPIRITTQALLLATALLIPWNAAAATAPQPKPVDEATRQRAIQMLQRGPAVFQENRGQWADAPVRFVMNGTGVNVGLTSQTMRFQIRRREGAGEKEGVKGPEPRGGQPAGMRPESRNEKISFTQFQTIFEGARTAGPEGRDKSDQVFHYRVGDASRWRENVAAWETVAYRGLYEGIDLVLRGTKEGLKYEFHLGPGADWRQIRMRYEGIAGLSLEESGALAIRPAEGWAPLTDGAPVIWQGEGDARKTVAGRFQKIDERTVGFEISGAVDASKPLVIDPDVLWSTYIGSGGNEEGLGVSEDPAGGLYIAGGTNTAGWVSGTGSTTYWGGPRDVWVARYSTEGAHLWSAYLGGGDDDWATCVAANGTAGVYVGGVTGSDGWIADGLNTTYGGGSLDGFVELLDNGGGHVWGTYLGGSDDDAVRCMTADGSGTVYVGGYSVIADWAGTYNGGPMDGFIAVISSDAALVWSAFVGGTNSDSVEGIAVDGLGNVLVTGFTDSAGWVTGGYGSSLHAGGHDAFAAKYDGGGTPLWSTYIGADGEDNGRGIAADSQNNAIVVGDTAPTLASWAAGGMDTSYNGGTDGFAVKISPSGAHVWSTYLGGAQSDTAWGVVTGENDAIYIAGSTDSTGWLSGGWDSTHNGGTDAYLMKLNALGEHRWSGYIGGPGNETTRGLAKGYNADFFITGTSNQGGWANRGTFNGGTDAFLTKAVDNGALQVWLEPAEARTQGAKWRRIGGSGAWMNSGDVETNLQAGGYAVEFQDTADWLAPTPQGVTVVNADVTSVTFTYTRKTGGLSVTIEPIEAAAAGAQWRRVGTLAWFNSGDVEAGIVTGDYQVEFSTIAGWTTPANLDVRVDFNQTNEYTGTYAVPGALRVFIDPVEAIADGGQWRRVGSLTWMNDSAIEGNLAPGNYTVEFKAIPGWGAPANQAVTVVENETAEITGTYVRQYGSLQVTIGPAPVLGLGAQWRRTDGDGTWFNSGDIETSVPTGAHDVEFSAVADWNPPANQPVTVLNNQMAAASGTYTRQTGSLTVTIGPAAAITDGARWRRVEAGGPWFASGQTETGIPTGSYTVEFINLANWDEPVNQAVDILNNATASASGTYVRHVGSLQVNLDPPAAVALGAQWRRQGTGPWFNTGDVESNVPTGTYTLEFKPVPGWAGASGQQATVSRGSLTTVSGTYYPVGSLQVTIAPAAAAAAGAQWRRVGTLPWFNSGDTEPNVAATNHDIEFSAVAGWNTPANVPVTVEAGLTATATGTYLQQTGGLKVTLAPQAAVAAGAQWRRTGTGPWLDSGATETDVPVGNHSVEFKSIGLWTTPASKPVSIVNNLVTETSATYTPQRCTVLWSSYLGGTNMDEAYGVTVDNQDEIYITGRTATTGWVLGSYDSSQNGGYDAFVVKVGPWGSHRWSTYLGAGGKDEGWTIARDGSGNILVGGITDNPTGWISGGYDTSYGGSFNNDAFIIKLASDGTPVWGTLVGDSGDDSGVSIAADANGDVYLAGSTSSATGMISGGWRTAYGGGTTDGFVVKVSGAGLHLWSTYLGGANADDAARLCLDAARNVYVIGTTDSPGWVAGGPETTLHGGNDAYVCKIDTNGTHQWSTYLGGTGYDYGYGIALDTANNLYITGFTYSTGWLTGGYNPTMEGTYDAYLAKLTNAGAMVWGSYVSSSGLIMPADVELDGQGSIYVGGFTNKADWIQGGFNSTFEVDAVRKGFVAKFGPLGRPLWSSLLGGNNSNEVRDLVVDIGRRIVAVGYTESAGWTAWGYNTVYGGLGDGFVARMQALGELYVGITPPEAVAAGGQWRRTVTTGWLDGNTTETGIWPNQYTVEFKPLAGWYTPANVTLPVPDSPPVAITGNYVMKTGTLQGTITPVPAVAAGAKWRRVGTGPWLDSGAAETAAPIGTYAVEFLAIANWTKPADQMVTVNEGQTTTFNGDYLRHMGSLTVTILPPGAAAAGATWRVPGVTGWMAGGVTVNNIPTGAYQVQFSGGVAGWTAPPAQPVTIAQGPASSVTGTYYASGSLRVTINPGQANTDGARWRRQGTAAWLASGFERDVPVGSYTIEFLDVTGWTTPGTVAANVSQGGTAAQKSATYVRQTGSLTVDVYPAVAVTDGGQWRRAGTNPWLNTGVTEASVPTGNVMVEFKPLANWTTPNPAGVVVNFNEESRTSGTYLSPLGNMTWSTYVGGDNIDRAWGVAADDANNIFVTGETLSTGWISGGAFSAPGGDVDAFVLKLTPAGQPVWSTYLGGTLVDIGYAVAVDPAGRICVAGETSSTGWLTLGSGYGGAKDGFVFKLNADGTAVGGTYVGGVDNDICSGIGVDSLENIYVCGETSSAGWITGGWNSTFGGGGLDGYALKLNPSLVRVWGNYLGSPGWDLARKLAVDGSNNAIVCGSTFPAAWIAGGYDTTPNALDAYVVKLDSNGTHLWSTYVGGDGEEIGQAVAVDPAGNICVAGQTQSAGWVSGGSNTTYSGGTDGFAVKLTPAGAFMWSTYLGGVSVEFVNDVAMDAKGGVYVVGHSFSPGWVSGGFNTTYQYDEAYLVRLSPTGQHIWSTYLGGNDTDNATGVTLDRANKILVSGLTLTAGWTVNGYDTSYNGYTDGFVAKLENVSWLRVGIQPPQAVSAGAKWRRFGETAWRDSGTSATVQPGPQTIEFRPVAGWNNPPLTPVTVSDIEVTSYTGVYSRQTGNLKVTIEPPSAISDGAQWRLSIQPVWRNSGTILTNLPTGNYTVVYNTLPNWSAPANQVVAVVNNQTAETTGTYVHDTGSLRVGIEPPEAVTEGARWRRVGAILWLNGGDTETGIDTGNYDVEFMALSGWLTPAKLPVTIQKALTAQTTGTYQRMGNLSVTIEPPEAVAQGAQWRRAGTVPWFNSGDTETGVAVGTHLLELKNTADWAPPANQTADVLRDQTAAALVTYARATGALTANIYPLPAVGAGAQWRRQGGSGAWLDSGTSETGILTGAYTVEFKDVSGWSTPAPVGANVYNSQLTQTSGTYTAVQAALIWSTYAGGNDQDQINDVAVDASGDIYLTGMTKSAGWLSGGPDTTPNGDVDAFVLKLSAGGTPVWGTYLGGTNVDIGRGIAVDGTSVYVAGETGSAGWISGGYSNTYLGGPSDGFVVKLGPTGMPVWGNYLGHSDVDVAWGVGVDTFGRVNVCGETGSAFWTGTWGWKTTYQGGSRDGFVVQLMNDGQFSWSSFVGGDGEDSCRALAMDGRNIYLTGYTNSAGWVASGWNPNYAGGYDGFVVKLNGSGMHLWSSYLGGASLELGFGVACDAQGNVFATGRTASAGWVAGGPNTVYGGADDAYVVKLLATGEHAWSTYLGGANQDYGNDAATDNFGNVYVTGYTGSAGWTSGGMTTKYIYNDAFLAKLSGGGRHLWSTYLGGTETDEGLAVAVDATRKVIAAGMTQSPGWVQGGYDLSYGGGNDGYVVRILNLAEIRVDIVPPAAVALGAKWRRVGTSLWLDSGTTESALAAGNYTVEFRAVPGYTTPADITLTAIDGQLTVVTGVYVPFMGTLQVGIDPPGAMTDGAQWRRVGTSTWLNGGTSETVPIGAYQVEFKPIAWWDAPPAVGVTILKDQLTQTTGTYIRHLGTLTVTIQPPEAVTDGARWRRVGTSPWLASGDTEVNVPTGNVRIEFLPVATWAEPAIVTVQVVRNQNTAAQGLYRKSDAALTVTIEPPEAVSSGAQWRRAGTPNWLDSGVTETNLIVGPCPLEFKTIALWTQPAPTTVTLVSAQTTLYTGTYVRHTGNLTVTLTPPGAVAAGAKWRRIGTAVWMNSGATESGIPTGNYVLEFLAIPDWTEPGDRGVAIVKDQTTAASYAYVQHTGALKVDISPAGANTAGAMWRRVGTATWLFSGVTESGVPVGPVSVEFKPVTGWTTPATVTGLTVLRSQLTTAQGAYVRQLGSLQVLIAPAGAVEAWGQWRRTGTTAWLDSGTIEKNMPTGPYTIEFKAVANWITPANITVTVNQGQTGVGTGVYKHETGSLKVNITPAGANAAGAAWRRVGTTTWLSSGATESAVPTGDAVVECKDLAAAYWLKPGPQTVKVLKGKTTTLGVSYGAALTVTATAPLVQAVQVGQGATLSVTATGVPKITYQWMKNGAAVAGQTAASLRLSPIQLDDEANYVCVARNAYTSAESPVFQVVVHNGTGVIQYLLGQRSSPAGLDFNGDKKVDIADAVTAVRLTPPRTPWGPSPADKASWVIRRPRLDWADSAKAASYDLYLWTGATRPAQPTAAGLTVTQWDVPKSLIYYTTYKWQVVARRADVPSTIATGPVWTFTTEKPVRVLAPNGGQTLTRGGAVTITWKVDMTVAGNEVRLELWRGGVKAALLKDKTSTGTGIGTLSVLIPDTSAVPPDSNYRIRAISTKMEASGGTKAWDESDGDLTIN